jgi:hypothetical protein
VDDYPGLPDQKLLSSRGIALTRAGRRALRTRSSDLLHRDDSHHRGAASSVRSAITRVVLRKRDKGCRNCLRAEGTIRARARNRDNVCGLIKSMRAAPATARMTFASTLQVPFGNCFLRYPLHSRRESSCMAIAPNREPFVFFLCQPAKDSIAARVGRNPSRTRGSARAGLPQPGQLQALTAVFCEKTGVA